MIRNLKIFATAIVLSSLLVACDDDDNVTVSPQAVEINNLLITGNWVVESLIDDGEDETADYANYVLSFNDAGQVTASHSSDSNLSRTGTYLVFEDDGLIELAMNFVNPNVIDELDDDWYFVSQSGNTLTWDDTGDVLVIRKLGDNESLPPITGQPSDVAGLITPGDWVVESLIDDGEDETADFANYVLSFNEQGEVVATHDSDSNLTRSGTYTVFEDDGLIELEMNFINPGIIDDLHDDWYFVSQSGNSITWEDSGDILILTKL